MYVESSDFDTGNPNPESKPVRPTIRVSARIPGEIVPIKEFDVADDAFVCDIINEASNNLG
jgi:hypothetical protein